ncbi:MAG TPA: hypothetical protein VHC46_06175, partial [Thermodesulfobacteriota bacterium]|nr:hypothetical protein [Thermodesulfobacteriota bacterium]
ESALKSAALPTDYNLRGLARELSEIPTPEDGVVGSIVIQVWKADYDPVTLVPSGVLLRSLEVNLDGN